MEPRRLKVLGIDDDPGNRRLLRAVVERHLPTAELLMTSSGREGLEVARSEDPDVILLDILMPEMDGFAVCRAVKADERLREIPVLFVSSLRSDIENRLKALEAGAEGFVSKPFDSSELVAQIRAMAKVKIAHQIERWEKDRLATLVAEGTRELEREFAERRRAEEEAALAARDWQATFDSTNDAIWILDKDQRVIRSNQTGERFFSWPCVNMVGRPCWEIAHGTEEPIAGCPFERARKSLKREMLELQIGERWFEIRVDPLLDDTGNFAGAVHVASEISDRKVAEERLLRTQKLEALGTLTSGIAHDFNNILLAITGNTKLALEELEPDHPSRRSLQEIAKASARAVDLVRRVLSLSRTSDLKRETLPLRPVVEDALKLVRATLPAMIEIRTKYAPELPSIVADATQVHQIILNLATNAAYAIGSQTGHIDVELTITEGQEVPDLPAGTFVQLVVRDSGSGMDRATMARIFDPFFTTKPPGSGTGLGLSLVHGIVKSCGGAISVDSEPGKGTTFRLHFPAAAGQPSVAPSRPERETLGRGERILYVDDEESLVFLTKRMLERLGYCVTGCTNPAEAVVLFRHQPESFAAVVTDMAMPGMSGFELAEALSAIKPDVPILMTTGYVRPGDEDTARQIGIRALILKPDTIDELGEVLARELAGAQAPSTQASSAG